MKLATAVEEPEVNAWKKRLGIGKAVDIG